MPLRITAHRVPGGRPLSTNVRLKTFPDKSTAPSNGLTPDRSAFALAFLIRLEHESWLLTVENEARLDRKSKQRTENSKSLSFGMSCHKAITKSYLSLSPKNSLFR